MPTYEFRCANGHVFEQFHKISDAPSTATCPECGAQAERAISGGAGLVFKGSGFYLTDYGKNAHRTGGSAPAKPAEGKSDGGAKSDAGASSGGSSGGSASGASGGASGGGGGTSSGGSSAGGGSAGGSGGGSGSSSKGDA